MVRTKQTTLDSNAPVLAFRFPPNVKGLSTDEIEAMQERQREDKGAHQPPCVLVHHCARLPSASSRKNKTKPNPSALG